MKSARPVVRHDPLEPPPPESPVAAAFLKRFGLRRPPDPDAAFLEQVARAFSHLPYENLTKIIKLAKEGTAEHARRAPREVLTDHVTYGTGGTCFSLTALLLHVVRACGYQAEPVLADRHYGPNTHCALIVNFHGTPHLVDPGYLVFRPVPIRFDARTEIQTPFNTVILLPEQGDRLSLLTRRQGSETKRLTFKLPGADPGEFLKAWHESFFWEMMRYPLLTCCRDGKQLYLRKGFYQERDHTSCRQENLQAEVLLVQIARRFGIDPKIAAEALSIVLRREKSLE